MANNAETLKPQKLVVMCVCLLIASFAVFLTSKSILSNFSILPFVIVVAALLPWLYWALSVKDLSARVESPDTQPFRYTPFVLVLLLGIVVESAVGLDVESRYLMRKPLFPHSIDSFFLWSVLGLQFLVGIGCCSAVAKRLSGTNPQIPILTPRFLIIAGFVLPVCWYALAGPLLDFSYQALSAGWFLSLAAGYLLAFCGLFIFKASIQSQLNTKGSTPASIPQEPIT